MVDLKMMKCEVATVKDAVHKLQLSLLEGIKHEKQLSAAGSLLSRSDYQDVVTERTIARMCGYPLCSNSLPSEQPRKGHYRISLKEHRVYDLHETYMYCCSGCLIESRAFAASLQEERCSTLNPAKLNRVLELFEGFNLDSSVDVGKNGDLGLSRLTIQEKGGGEGGEVSLEEWIGPSNAIDGYVPRIDRNLEAHQPNDNINEKKGRAQGKVESKHRPAQPDVPDILSYDMNFTSVIITEDEYTVSKTVPSVKGKESKGMSSEDVNCESKPMRKPAASSVKTQKSRSKKSDKRKDVTATDEIALENTISPGQNDTTEVDKKLHPGKEFAAGATVLKSSLKTSDSKKAMHSVTWADEKSDGGQNLHECRELKDGEGAQETSHSAAEEVGEESYRFESAEACARALSQAAEAVASGNSDASDAVSEAGVIILPPPHGVDEFKSQENDVEDIDPVQLKWPPKPGFSSADLFDSDDSWYDNPPEEFNLTLSPFSTMFMALFAWISSSSLAYIYGKEGSSHEEYLSVNGREYPHKIFSPDGRSSEIKQTLAGCLSRTLPGLVAELRIRVPLSILEQGLGCLLDTMSFLDPLPAFRIKQWQVILMLFLDALSVSRIPALTPYMLDGRILLPKVLEGAHISVEEFEIMKDLMIPLGRVPHLSTQSGG